MFLDCLEILYLPGLLPCLREIVIKMPLLELEQKIASMKEALQNEDGAIYEKIIHDFFKIVSQLRTDTADLLKEEMSETEYEEPIWMPKFVPYPVDMVLQTDILYITIKICMEKAVKSGFWLELYSCMTILCCSPDRYNRLVLKLYERELLTCPKHLGPKQQKSMMEDLLRLTQDDLVFRSKFLGCIGDFAKLYPTMMKKVKTELSRFLLENMGNRHTTVNTMINLLALLELFKGRKSHDFLKEVFSRTVLFVNDKHLKIQLHAIKIIGKIAERCSSFPSSPIARSVKEQLSSLLMKLHSCDPEISMSAAVCIKHCLPHVLGRPAWLGNLLSRPSRTVQMTPQLMGIDSSHIEDIYIQLQRRGLLKQVLIDTILNVESVDERHAFIKHICFMKEKIPHSQLSPIDLYVLWMGLKRGLGSKAAFTKDTAKAATVVLGEKWKSLATVCSAEPFRPGNVLSPVMTPKKKRG